MQIVVYWRMRSGRVHQWPKKQQGQACLPAPAGGVFARLGRGRRASLSARAGADMGRHKADRLRYLPRLGRHKACPYFSLASVATVAFFIFSSSLKGLILMVRV